MRKFTRIAVLAAAPAILIGAVATAAPAFAAAAPGGGTTTCTAANQEALNTQGVISNNLSVPAGQTCQLRWVRVLGNANVAGSLSAASDVFMKNVTVSGPDASMTFFNQASHVVGNLSVTGSGHYWPAFGDFTQYAGQNGALATSQVDGNFTFANNTGDLYVGYSMHVTGSATGSGNTGHIDTSGLTADGGINITS